MKDVKCRGLREEIEKCPAGDSMKLVHHGTRSEAAARSILREGFREGTYFTPELDSAIGYGGPWVFSVASCVPDDHRWQWIEDPPPCVGRISRLDQFSKRNLYEDDSVRNAVFEFNIKRRRPGDN